jgi:uncharacterized protein YyaL (SSP411 family)
MLRFSPNPNRADLVRWYEWGEEAFSAAQEQNKPMMLFLSAFWCRYCQRMDEEAFSQTENIALLRAYFIPIRAENSQRPDLDARYNQNGWPTIVFMTPLGVPIVAANYLNTEDFQDMFLRVYIAHQQAESTASTATSGPHENADTAPSARTGSMPDMARLAEITEVIMAVADSVHGGYGNGQKFIQPEVNDFLLSRYEATGNLDYLTHVCLTLDKMRECRIHDECEGGYFRTSTGPDWDQPHREKLLIEQAGLIGNALRAYRITRRPEYARMAEDIISYVNRKLFDESIGAAYGCEDFLRTGAVDKDEFFTVIDRCIYSDANALAASAYMDAAATLDKVAYRERALRILEFLRLRCADPAAGVFHYFDGTAQLGSWLGDQVFLGSALLRAHEATHRTAYLDYALQLADFVATRFRNPDGGYYDIAAGGSGCVEVRLTLIELNGPTALFFLELARITDNPGWREAAAWALRGFGDDLRSYGVHAAAFGIALARYLETSFTGAMRA